jgi:hypothetical protein
MPRTREGPKNKSPVLILILIFHAPDFRTEGWTNTVQPQKNSGVCCNQPLHGMPSSPDFARHASDGGGNQRPCLELGRNCGTAALIFLWPWLNFFVRVTLRYEKEDCRPTTI